MPDPLDSLDPNLDSNRRWRNRRRMAWLSMWAGVLFPLMILAAHNGAAIGAIAGPFYLFVGMVVSTYIGAATWEERR